MRARARFFRRNIVFRPSFAVRDARDGSRKRRPSIKAKGPVLDTFRGSGGAGYGGKETNDFRPGVRR